MTRAELTQEAERARARLADLEERGAGGVILAIARRRAAALAQELEIQVRAALPPPLPPAPPPPPEPPVPEVVPLAKPGRKILYT